jgi:hypothetical protein
MRVNQLMVGPYENVSSEIRELLKSSLITPRNFMIGYWGRTRTPPERVHG